MAIADALGAYPNQGADMGPPSPGNDPVMLEQNKFHWRNYLASLNDPNVRQALIATGVGLMQSPGYGQNSGDVIGRAIGSGVQTLQGLRNIDYQKKTTEQARQDKLGQNQVQNQQGQQQIDISNRNANTNERAVTSQIGASDRTQSREDVQTTEQGRHNKATEAIQSKAADADLLRARSYSSIGNRVPADIQKINMLAQHYTTDEGMDEIAARARAVMVVDSTGAAKSPGEQAGNLYKAKIQAWSNDISNFGKTMTPEQSQAMLQDSINDVVKLGQFNAAATGAAPPETQRSGPIKRPAEGTSQVGTVKGKYKKTKAGPDSDKSTWTEVATGTASGKPKQ